MTTFTEYLKGNLTDYAIEYRVHATRRMFQRHISQQDIECLLARGQVIERYDEDFPLPSVLLSEHRVAKRPLHAVVGINDAEQKLVLSQPMSRTRYSGQTIFHGGPYEMRHLSERFDDRGIYNARVRA